MRRRKLTQKRLKELLHYDPETGIFTWNLCRPGCSLGASAGSLKSHGYVDISLDSVGYGAHRLAYFYMKGYLPEHLVDHRNGDSKDNRWCNLRHATQSCNGQNLKINLRNKSGFPGVSWHHPTGRWQVHIQIRKKGVNLGNYDTALEAALARLTVEVQCSEWTCNHRSELVKVIKAVWPGFNNRSLN